MDGRARAELNRAMAELADGQRAALPVVLALLLPVLTSYCRALLGDADADDAAQESLMTLMGRASGFRRDGDALSWALGIATWQCRTYLRRRGREAARSAPPVELPGTGADPEVGASIAELRGAIRVALAELSPADRSAVEDALVRDVGPLDAAARKRRQRAFARLRLAWRRLHGDGI